MKLHITENYKMSYDEPIYKGDLFINKDGITKKVVRIVGDDITVRDINTGMINHIRKDYLVNNFELVDAEEGFEECVPAKTSYMGEEKIKNYAYNLDSDESRRKEIADRFGRTFTPDDHILVCKDGKKLNIQVGKKYKCTATNGQRVEIVSIDEIFPEDNGDSALITAFYRGKMIAIGSTQLYESNSIINKSRTNMNEDYDPNGFAVTGYLQPNKRSAYADRYFGPNDWSEVEAYAHDLLMQGLYTNIWYIKTGDAIDIDPDEYINNFDGEFEVTPEIAEFKNRVLYNESLTEKISEKDYTESKKGIAYKVFQFKNGKLYPPMVANAGNAATPTGVWLDAEPGEFVEIDGLQRVVQRGVKGDRLKQRIANLDTLGSEERKKEVEKIKHSTLAYRPGWHLGDIPRAAQFDRKASWEILDEIPEDVKISGNVTNEDTLAKKGTPGNIGKYFYIKSTGQYAHIIGGDGQVFFPYDFVWAECEYVADIDYQDEAMSYGYRKGKKFQHSLAGLPRVPEGGSYKYRTNPRPDTVPWVITGAIKVTKLLDDYDVQKILGGNAPERQGGDKTLAEMGLRQI